MKKITIIKLTKNFEEHVYEEEGIFITPVVNEVKITTESRKYSGYRSFPILVEKKLTNEIIRKFNIIGQLKVTSKEDGALKLTCTIKDYRKDALRYSDSDDIEEQRLRLFVAIKLYDASGELLKSRSIVGREEYFLTGANSRTETAAHANLIEDTARQVLEAVIERW